MLPLDILSRWIHIAAAAFVVGGFVYARFVVLPAVGELNGEERSAMLGRLAARLKNLGLIAIVLLLVSGSYNFYKVVQGGVDAAYHMAFGIKFLLALHIFAMLFILGTPPSGDAKRDAKRPRLLFGGMISGLIVLLLGAYLRTLHS